MSYAVKKSKVNEAGNYTKRKGTAEGKQFVPQPKPRFAVKNKD